MRILSLAVAAVIDTTVQNSHAHEELPGTVNVQVLEGDDTAYGQALFPVPANDPNDPLQVRSTVNVCSC